MNVTYSLKHFVKCGRHEAQRLLTEHILFFLDPGEDLEIGGIAVRGHLDDLGELSYKWIPIKANAKKKKALLHMDEPVRSPEYQREMARLSINHPRKTSMQSIETWYNTLQSSHEIN